jgi:oligopeptide transport system permease protein
LGSYILKRIGSMLITLVFVIALTFFLMRALPGGPFTREKQLPPEIEQAIIEKYHLNDPLIVQFKDYFLGVLRLDFGPSYTRKGETVRGLLELTFPVSAKLGIVAATFVMILGMPLGIISALKQNSWEDYVVTILATVGVAVPSFVIGAGLRYFLTTKLGLLPATGLDTPASYIMPVIALSGFSLAFVARLTRSSMLEVLRQDYIRTARAKGLSEFVVIGKHALKNALLPVITYMGPMIAAVMTGSFVVERLFGIPGMGDFFVSSVQSRDYTMIMGTVILYAALYIVMIFLVDIIYVYIDPRIKLND